MITVEAGDAVARFLERATSRAELYAEVTLCSPFLDAQVCTRIRDLAAAASKSGCAITIVTSREGATQLRLSFGRANVPRALKIRVRARVHAKVYIMTSRKYPLVSEALITSANLTGAALTQNEELGVRAVANSYGGQRLCRQIDRSLRRLTADSQQRRI